MFRFRYPINTIHLTASPVNFRNNNKGWFSIRSCSLTSFDEKIIFEQNVSAYVFDNRKWLSNGELVIGIDTKDELKKLIPSALFSSSHSLRLSTFYNILYYIPLNHHRILNLRLHIWLKQHLSKYCGILLKKTNLFWNFRLCILYCVM